MSNVHVFAEPHHLPGTLVDWRHTLGDHYLRLGNSSRRRRFMSALPDRSVRIIADRANPEVVLGIRHEDVVIGVLEIFRETDDHAEIGVSVEDAFQGLGYGKALFLAGLSEAERLGLRIAGLYFASDNLGIRALIDAAGGDIVQQGGECVAEIDLAPERSH